MTNIVMLDEDQIEAVAGAKKGGSSYCCPIVRPPSCWIPRPPVCGVPKPPKYPYC